MSLSKWTVLLTTGVSLAPPQSSAPVFTANTNLQSIVVQVTDKRGNGIQGLDVSEFTLLEDGKRQKIAFFGTEKQPISLAILLDASASMKSSRKLERAQALLGPLIRGNQRDDQIFLVPFTAQIGSFVALTPEQRLATPIISSSERGGTALFDSIATALCRLRSVPNVRQAVVVITDGADQQSRLRLEQLLNLAQSSNPQIFMIGFWGQDESDYYRHSGETVTLVNGQDIDNPIQVFEHLAKDSGAESFFPATDRDLKSVLERILGILRAQYTLAYYPEDVNKPRSIQVKVHRLGVSVASRRTVGSAGGGKLSVKFDSTCKVSPQAYPYPWEALITHEPSGAVTYRETFTNPRTGWPNRPRSHYVAGAYEMSRKIDIAQGSGHPGDAPGSAVAYGPWWTDFRATLLVDDESSDQEGEGMVFRLNGNGYYALLLTRIGKMHSSFKLIKHRWDGALGAPFFPRMETTIIPWSDISELHSGVRQTRPGKSNEEQITVECRGPLIKVWLDGADAVRVRDESFQDGYIGMAQFGYGRALFRDLEVQGFELSAVQENPIQP